MAAVLRGALDDRGQGRPAHRAAAAVPRLERGAPTSPPPATRGGSHERRGQDPRRQHLRRQRRPRRHRGVADRSDRAVLLRHPVPLEVGAHRRRPAPQPAVGRRPAVLRDPVLPGAGHRHRLHRRQAVGHPPARRRRRLPRGAHDPQPRREGRSTSRCASRRPRDFADLFEVKDALQEEGRVLHARRRRPPGARLPPRDVRARDLDLGDGGLRRGRARPHVQRPRRAPRRVDDRPARDARARRRRREHRAAQVRAARQEGAAEHGAQPREVARRGAEPRLRLGPAQADLPAQPRRPRGAALLAGHRCPATTCRPPGCPGS